MFGHTKWGILSLTITKSVPCLRRSLSDLVCVTQHGNGQVIVSKHVKVEYERKANLNWIRITVCHSTGWPILCSLRRMQISSRMPILKMQIRIASSTQGIQSTNEGEMKERNATGTRSEGCNIVVFILCFVFNLYTINLVAIVVATVGGGWCRAGLPTRTNKFRPALWAKYTVLPSTDFPQAAPQQWWPHIEIGKIVLNRSPFLGGLNWI